MGKKCGFIISFELHRHSVSLCQRLHIYKFINEEFTFLYFLIIFQMCVEFF